jgi:ribosomal protein S18 acetylase RimI-like enzyme
VISVRIATPGDAGAIRDLTCEAYAKWVAVIGREPMPMTADYDAAVRKHRFDLLYRGDELAALIETRVDPDSVMIENLAVRPAFQRRGLGERLLALADEIAAPLGLPVRLYTNQLMAENIAFYQARGFVIESQQAPRVNMIKLR